MKQKIILAVCSFFLVASAHSQVTVKSSAREFKVEFKRCITNKDLTFIDFLITNLSDLDYCLYHWEPSIYDDEGLVYQKEKVYLAGDKDYKKLSPSEGIVIPSGITYRARIVVVDGFNKYATKLQLLQFKFLWKPNNIAGYLPGNGIIEIRNIPIVRE